MEAEKFKVGVVYPGFEMEQDPLAIRDFAQAVEAMGYSHIVAYDHVLGADITNRPDWQGPYDADDAFFEPFTLFSYLAGLTETLELVSGIFVLPQRQTALFAKQAACVDILCNGRLRLGVAIGWNEVEYEALGVPFRQRGARLDDQIAILRRLWTEPTLTARTPFHNISEAGLNPLPVQRPIPLWIGGVSEVALDRAATTGDGWLSYGYASHAQASIDDLRERTLKAGRKVEDVGVENIIFIGEKPNVASEKRTPEAAAEDAAIWQDAGARAVSFETLFLGCTTVKDHIAVLERIAKVLGLSC